MKWDRVIELCQVGCRKANGEKGDDENPKEKCQKGEEETETEMVKEVTPLKLPRELTVRINLYGFACIRV